MNEGKIKEMAEHVIRAAYEYAQGKDFTNNEAVNAMVSASVALVIGLNDNKTDLDVLQGNLTTAVNGCFDSMREANSK